MRLIDADALVQILDEYDLQLMIGWVEDALTIDAVPVVRCRECMHRPFISDHDEIGGFKYEFPDDRCPCNCEDGWYSWMPDDNWFCGNGERREEEI